MQTLCLHWPRPLSVSTWGTVTGFWVLTGLDCMTGQRKLEPGSLRVTTAWDDWLGLILSGRRDSFTHQSQEHAEIRVKRNINMFRGKMNINLKSSF